MHNKNRLCYQWFRYEKKFMSGQQLELSELKRAWIDDSFQKFNARDIGQFSVEELRLFLSEPPHENWWGCLVAKLRCTGKIKEIGRVKSTRTERNGAKITLWKVV